MSLYLFLWWEFPEMEEEKKKLADGPPGFEKTRHKCLNWRMFCVSQHDYESWEILASVNGAPMEHLDFRLSESRMGPSVLSSYLSRRANRVLAAKKTTESWCRGSWVFFPTWHKLPIATSKDSISKLVHNIVLPPTSPKVFDPPRKTWYPVGIALPDVDT